MAHVEDSYEGAVRRLERLGHSLPPIPPMRGAPRLDPSARQRDLEELARLACEENERLEAELGALRDENARLSRRVSMLEDTIADPRGVLGLPALSPTAAASFESPGPADRRGGAVAAAIALSLCALIAAIAAWLATSPASHLRWAQPSSSARLRATIDAVRGRLISTLARGARLHPRYGRTDLVLVLPSAPPEASAAAPVVPAVTAPSAPTEPAPPVVSAKGTPDKRKTKPPRRTLKRRATKRIHGDRKDPLAGLSL